MNKKISLKRISIDMVKKLLKLIEEKSKEQTKKKRGRPKVYSDNFILLLYFIKVIRNYSFRDIEFYLKETFKEKIPSISTLHYRFHRLELSYFEDLFEEVLKKLNITEEEILELMIVDGTGFGYDEKERLNWMRGKRIREVSSHAKLELIVGRKRDGRDIIIRVRIGPAYSDERKLLKEIIGEIKVKSKYLRGDVLYGMDVELLRLFLDKSEEVITPIKDTLHMKVKNPFRKKVKEREGR